MPPIEQFLRERAVTVLGADWLKDWWVGLPLPWDLPNGGIYIYSIHYAHMYVYTCLCMFMKYTHVCLHVFMCVYEVHSCMSTRVYV